MRNLKSYLSLLFMGALALTACQDDFDDPTIPTPESTWLADTGTYKVFTIEEVKKVYWKDGDNYFATIGDASTMGDNYKDDTRHILVKGTITSSDAAGNIYKSMVIQDATGSLAMSINANSMNGKYRRGQELVVDLTGMTIGKYSGLQQLGAPEVSPQYGNQTTFMPYELFQQHAQMNGMPDLAAIDTITVAKGADLLGTSPADLIKWQSQLVRFNNCHFAEGGETTLATSQETVSHTLTLEDGTEIAVRTSGYSNFYSEMIPRGHGDVVGILGFYAGSSDTGNNWQLTLIDRYGLMNFGNPTMAPGAEDNPYTVDEALAIINGGGEANQVWTKGYIVGAVAPGVTDITAAADIQWAGSDFFELDNTVVIASDATCTDFTKCMVINLPQGSKMRQYCNLVDHADNIGKLLEVRGNLAEVMGIGGLTGNQGSPTEFKLEGVEIPAEPGQTGNGTKESPYSVSQIIAMNPQSTEVAVEKGVWAGGYIVGYYQDYNAIFAGGGTQYANILIAASPDVKDAAQCICIQLVAKTDPRTALNLGDNPGNLGKYCTVYGDVMLYNKMPGIKNTSDYTLDTTGGDTPVTPPAGTGSGTENDPYSVGAIIAKNPQSTEVAVESNIWAQGYIVGYYENYTAVFAGGGKQYANILLAASPDVKDASQCICIQLVAKTDPRAALNLGDNPGNLGKLCKVYGDVMLYNKMPGIKNTSNYWLDPSTGGGDNPGGDTPGGDTPGGDTPTTGTSADFSSFGSTATSYGTYTSTTGWVATWAQILSGSANPDNKSTFAVFGTESDFAVCLNGRVSKQGILTSPTIAGGIGTLTFDYCQPYSDNKCKLTVNIKQNGAVVASDVLENNGMTKLTKYSYSHAFNISGDFVIEIVNDCPSANDTANKDRVALWNMSWTH